MFGIQKGLGRSAPIGYLAWIPSLFLELLSFKVDGEFKNTYSQAFNMILKEACISLLSVQCAILLEAPRRHFDIGKVQIFRSGRERLSEDSSLAEPGRETVLGRRQLTYYGLLITSLPLSLLSPTGVQRVQFPLIFKGFQYIKM